ncbi:MAG: hypothetical protein GW847_09505 [Zetaproteobacteria bacterium]|nr:hypothetical protein [Zetaproteobacteria bacterium]OIO10114.1 MAG: hypothetical protein AUJ53_07605 [Flavobacteriaceae bacterium CG1_02_35_72]PJA07143.1 MAG: hypothetical protein COX71_00090 [Flavobacteriales bacterium CG_4_10_14_0_2_um_filter_35_18]
MTKRLTVLFFIGFCVQLQSQIKQNSIIGTIHNDSISVEAIHIYNKNTHKGTISNEYGVFKIPVKENDTLVFDGIQFQKKEIIITSEMLKTKNFDVILSQNINELQTVEIKNHTLTGSLNIDASQVKKPPSFVGNDALNFSNIDLNVVDDIDEMDRRKPPDPYGGDSSLKFVGGVNLLGIVGFVLSPITNEVGKIGQHKRKTKQAEKVFQLKAMNITDQIKSDFGLAFFTDKLNIPREQIDAFLIFCKSKNLAGLYLNNHKIELIEVLIEESQAFKKEFKN